MNRRKTDTVYNNCRRTSNWNRDWNLKPKSHWSFAPTSAPHVLSHRPIYIPVIQLLSTGRSARRASACVSPRNRMRIVNLRRLRFVRNVLRNVDRTFPVHLFHSPSYSFTQTNHSYPTRAQSHRH